MSDAFNSRSLSAAVINAICIVSLDTTLAYIITAGASVMCPIATSQAFLRNPFSLIANTRWHSIYWCPTSSLEPSGSILNTMLTSAISFAIASRHRVFPLASSITWALLTIFSTSNPNLCVRLWYWLLMARSVHFLFLRT